MKEKEVPKGYPHKLFLSPVSNSLALLLATGGAVYLESVPLTFVGYVVGGIVGYCWDRYDDRRLRRLALMDQSQQLSLPHNTPETIGIVLNQNNPGSGETRPGVRT